MKRLIALYLLSTPALAEAPNFSLFLTDEEQTLYRQVLPTISKRASDNELRLKAIMLLDEDQWTIWINDQKITPESCPAHMEIQQVSDLGVNMILKTPQGPREIMLKLNEPYVLDEEL